MTRVLATTYSRVIVPGLRILSSAETVLDSSSPSGRPSRYLVKLDMSFEKEQYVPILSNVPLVGVSSRSSAF